MRIARNLLAAGLLWLGTTALGQAQPTPAQTTPAAPSAAQQTQQDRMRTCNAEAGTRNLAGDPRRNFMSECLAGRMPPAPAPAAATPPQPSAAQQAQQDRMRTCNAEAGTRNLAGEARRSFMSTCLSGSTTPAVAAPTAAPTATLASYPTEAAARTACGSATVVWGTSDSKIYHLSGSRFYGKTQHGAYLCQPAAEAAGYRAAR